MTLRFSIVVPTLNRRQMLATALASIRAQGWPGTQVIVADGGSNDGTLDDLRGAPELEVVSGPDRGVYDAFNRGIARANGDLIGILNSDDSYEPGAFAAAAAALAPGIAAVCGTAVIFSEAGIVARFDDVLDKSLASPRAALIHAGCSINARFFRPDAMKRIGAFRVDFRYVADRDWLLRWYEAGLTTATIPDVVYRYRQHAGSLTFDADRRRERGLRKELIRLARHWRNSDQASPETSHAAMLLEGRCVAVLAAQALRAGRLGESAHWLFQRDGRPSLAPLLAAACGGVDRAREGAQATFTRSRGLASPT
jgi:glycosyltransferase involved in cell wall biosynthesis